MPFTAGWVSLVRPIDSMFCFLTDPLSEESCKLRVGLMLRPLMSLIAQITKLPAVLPNLYCSISHYSSFITHQLQLNWSTFLPMRLKLFYKCNLFNTFSPQHAYVCAMTAAQLSGKTALLCPRSLSSAGCNLYTKIKVIKLHHVTDPVGWCQTRRQQLSEVAGGTFRSQAIIEHFR